MEDKKMDDDKKMAWKKLLSVFGVFFLIMAVWQIVVLELLKNGVIGTMVAMILICAATVIIFGLVFASVSYTHLTLPTKA